jgi:phenol 2-monooxygenase
VSAADAREVNIQDLAPADAHFKLFIFPGEKKHAQKVAAYLGGGGGGDDDDGAARRSCRFFNEHRDAFDVITVLQGSKSTANYLDVPPVLRPHWSK